MPRAIREVLLVVAVASLMPLFIGVAMILAGTGMERGYELWFLAVLVTTAFFPLAGTAAAARLTLACVERAHSWRLASATGAGLMLALTRTNALADIQRVFDKY